LAAIVTVSSTVENISPGLRVEVGEIDRKLGELWSASEAGKVRASLINLVIYSESKDAIAINTPLLAGLAADHAFRALLVQADPSANETKIEAWITAHCHLREAGGQKEICSEQITFRLNGPAAGRLPSIVFSHLDSDLPLCLWWQGPLHPNPAPDLWAQVDRIIVDSHSWPDPASQFSTLQEIESIGRGRCSVCDLTWTRAFHLRYAIAQIFDHAAAREHLSRIRHVEIRYGAGHRITALELLGWMASRLGWQLVTISDQPVFRQPDGQEVRCTLHDGLSGESCVGDVRFDLGDAKARVERSRSGDFYLAEFTLQGHAPIAQMLPAGRERTEDILLSELGRVGRHPLFWPAIRSIEPLLHGG